MHSEQKQTHRQRKQTHGYQRGKAGWRGGINWEFGIQTIVYTNHLYKINNKVLPCRTENCSQYLVINYNGKEPEKEYIYIYMYT